jgi:hypothetical protein
MLTQKEARNYIKKFGSANQASKKVGLTAQTILRWAEIEHFPTSKEQEDFIQEHCGVNATILKKRISRIGFLTAVVWHGGAKLKPVGRVKPDDKVIGYYDPDAPPSYLKEDLLWAIEKYLGKSLF